MNATLPDYKQSDDHDCGRAVIVSVLLLSGWKRELAESFVLNVPCDEWYGTRPEAIETALRLYFHTLAGEMTLDDLRHFTRTGRPVICAVNDHWIGVDQVQRRHVVYMNPSTGKHEQKTIAKFSEWWHDRGRFSRFQNFGIVAWPSSYKPQPTN
jgi:ABC-type bacteriocin/lantibiotic exporter with double-glycine peptidase domain